MAFVISAYAPPSFLKPCFVWQTCQCDETNEGAHMMGCFVETLNVDHAIAVAGQGIEAAHQGGAGAKWFEMGRFESFFSALEVHVRMALDMQNGRSEELWRAGYEPYLRIWGTYSQRKEVVGN